MTTTTDQLFIDRLFGRAIAAAGTPASTLLSDADVEALRALSYGDTRWHDALERLHKALEAGLRAYLKAHASEVQGWNSPERPIYEYMDTLENEPGPVRSQISDKLPRPGFIKIVENFVVSLSRKAKTGDVERIEARFPGYKDLLKEIRQAKREWTVGDKAIRQTHNFRMMGGLARMGTHEGMRYSSLVKSAQDKEKAVLGKALTSHTKVR